MSRYELHWVGHDQANALARALSLRGDMQAQFVAEGRQLPRGPKWAFRNGDRLLGLGGLRPVGAAASIGWLLVGEGVTVRDWAAARRYIGWVMRWASAAFIRRVHACPEASMDGARRLLERLGFEPTGEEGDTIVMTKELI